MTAFDVPSLVIDADIMQEANEATSWLLAVPDSARKAAKATFWTEMFDVASAEYGMDDRENAPRDEKGNPERLRIVLQFRVSAESPDPKNVGRPFKQQYLINPSKLHVKSSKERTMSMMSIGKLGNFLRAAGLIDEGTSANGLDLKEYFYGEAAPVVGAKVYATIKHGKDKDGVLRQEVSNYDDLTAGQEA